MKGFGAVLLLAAAACEAAPRVFDRSCDVASRRSSRGGVACSAFVPVLSEFATSAGTGMGAECACAAITTPDGGTVFNDRASSAWCIKSDFTHVSCGNNLPRVMTGRLDETWKGIAVESAATNLVSNYRDLTNAAWTKTNMTTSKTATGPDGVANSATIVTASAGNGTVTQGVTHGAGNSASSWYIRRRTGTGAVYVTRDNFTTQWDVGPYLSSDWKRVVPSDSIGCAGSRWDVTPASRCIVIPEMVTSATNPTIGLKIATNTDAVDVDLVQTEVGTFASTPTASSRVLDSVYWSVAAKTPPAFSFAATIVSAQVYSNNYIAQMWLNSNNNAQLLSGGDAMSAVCKYRSGGVGPDSAASTAGSLYFSRPARFACSWDGASVVTSSYQSLTGTGSTAAASITPTVMAFGELASNAATGAVVRNACFSLNGSAGCTSVEAGHATKVLATMGDSILLGTGASVKSQELIWAMLGTDFSHIEGAVANQTCAEVAARWAAVKAQGVTHLVTMCGVNDARLDNTAAAAFAAQEAMLDDALASNIKVRLVLTLNFEGAADANPTRIAMINDLRTLQQAWCTANSVTCANPASILQTGNQIQAKYHQGDYIHLNDLGASVYSSIIVQTAVP